MVTLSARAQKVVAAVILLIVVAAIAHFVPVFNNFDVSAHGISGFVIAFAFTSASYVGGQVLQQRLQAPRWLENTFSMSGMIPSWWVASLLFPAYVTLTGPVVAATILSVCALVALDYVLRNITELNRWF